MTTKRNQKRTASRRAAGASSSRTAGAARASTNGSSRVVNVGLTQMTCSDDARQNRASQVRLAEQAAKQGAQIICTQELFLSQYFCQVEDHRFFKLAETIPGPSTDALGKVAKKYRA